MLAKLNSAKFLSQYKARAFGEIFLLRNFCRIQYYVCASEARELQPFANCNEDYTKDSLAVAWILSIGLDVCCRLGAT